MPTKSSTDARYRIRIRRNGKYVYASTQPLVVDKKTGKKVYRHILWGRFEDGKFLPGTNFFQATPEVRGRLIFPEDWDLSAIEKMSGIHGRGRVENEECENRNYGDVWLLLKIAEITGLYKNLLTICEGNRELVGDILTLAIYPYITGFSFSRLSRWQRITKTPASRILTPSVITRITQGITERQRKELIMLRAKRLGKAARCAVDSTSRSSYGQTLSDIKWGKNKEGVSLPQTTEVVVYSLTDHTPVYYRTFPGNIPDSRTLELIMTELEHAGMSDVVLITDRGYESVRNIEMMIDKKQSFISMAKIDGKLISDKIRAFGDFASTPASMRICPDSRIYYQQFDEEYKIHGARNNIRSANNLKVNLYFDPERRAIMCKDLDVEIEQQRAALQVYLDSQIKVDSPEIMAREYRYFKLSIDHGTLAAFEPDLKKLERERRRHGFFSILSHGLNAGPMDIFEQYRKRDEQEKYFTKMKSYMGYNRVRSWSEDGKAGRELILFVGLTIASYLTHVWKNSELREEFSTTMEILDEMRSIRSVQTPGHPERLTPFVGAQLRIAEAFGIPVPAECSPTYESKKIKRGPGRPRKNQ